LAAAYCLLPIAYLLGSCLLAAAACCLLAAAACCLLAAACCLLAAACCLLAAAAACCLLAAAACCPLAGAACWLHRGRAPPPSTIAWNNFIFEAALKKIVRPVWSYRPQYLSIIVLRPAFNQVPHGVHHAVRAAPGRELLHKRATWGWQGRSRQAQLLFQFFSQEA
jgi:hypothetical protein